MKRILAVILSCIMLSTLLAGCAQESTPVGSAPSEAGETPSSEAAKEPVTIKIWHETDATIAKTIEDELAKLAPDVVVTVERKEKMSEALKLVGNDPSSAPDLYFFAHDKTGLYAQMGILAPITDFIDKSELADMLPMTVPAGTYKDSLYQLPVYFETLLFMYNKALMPEAPKTTDDLLAYMKANTKDGSYGFVEQHSTAYYSAGWIQGFGGFIINASAEPGLNTPEMVKSVTYHKQFVPYMPADGEYNTVTTLFKEGKAHSIISGPWLVPDIKAAGIDLGIAPMPVINESGKPITPFSGVQGVCVLKNAAAKKDAVAAVLRQLAKPDIGIALAKAANCAPANTKCYDDPAISANEMILAMKETAANVVPMPNVPEMDVMWSVTENMLAAVNKNNGDPQAECDKAQKEALDQIAAMQ